MSVAAVLQLLATAPLFASRGFLAAFLVGLVARFGDALPVLAGTPALTALQGAPPWFTSDVALVVLGLLAVVEGAAARNPDARQLFVEVDPYIKLGVALAIDLGLADAQSAALLQQLGTAEASPTYLTAGLDGAQMVAVVASLGTFWLAVLRKRVLTFLMDADDADDLGAQTALVWAEDAMILGGVLALAVFPALAVVLLVAAIVGLLGLERATAHLEASWMVDCSDCGHEIHPAAPNCPHCGVRRQPRDLSALGRPLDRPARPQHGARLLATKRCSHCATRLRSSSLEQTCPACGRPAFASPAAVAEYVSAVQRQLPKTLLVCAAFGAIPLVGLIPGIIYYRLSLLGGLRRYLPAGRSIATRWLARLLTVVLLALQWIPVVGAAMLPLLCLSHFALYRKALLGAADGVAPISATG